MSSSRVYLENLLEVRHLFQLLLEDRFRYIDKIKTSGTTYMAVVGLRPDRIIQDTEESITNHLSTLLEFYFALRSKVQSFNENHGFSFSLRAGKPPIYISIYQGDIVLHLDGKLNSISSPWAYIRWNALPNYLGDIPNCILIIPRNSWEAIFMKSSCNCLATSNNGCESDGCESVTGV